MGPPPQPGGQAMHPQQAGYMPSLLFPGMSYQQEGRGYTPMGETDDYTPQQMQQQQLQHQTQSVSQS